MSAFMVSDKTINKIVTFLDIMLIKEWPILTQHFRKAGFDVNLDNFREKLGNAMFELNIRAVESRYGKGKAKKFRELNYIFKPEYGFTPVPVYKSLNCWSYQCMEIGILTDPLYELMNNVNTALAAYIVTRLPEYDKAPWGD